MYFNEHIISAVILLINYGESARILFHIPTPTHSHNVVIYPIIEEMLSRGHDIVMISTHPLKCAEKYSNLRIINVNITADYWSSIFDAGTLHMPFIETCTIYEEVMPKLADMQLNHPEVAALIKNQSEHFDMVVIEYVKYHFLAGWAHRFKCPLFGLITLDAFYNEHDTIGNPFHPYLYSAPIYDFFLPHATFYQRLKTVYYSMILRYYIYTWGQTYQNYLLKKNFGNDAPDVYELSSNISMVFASQTEIFNQRPKVPTWRYMSMMHVSKTKKPLNKKLRDFFDNSPEGVVYFSLGSNVKSSSLSYEWTQNLIKAFAKLPYKVLWKWEKKALPNQPSNLETCQWCPQQDILAEKNLKLFITQGGYQSIEEAIYHKVPVLGIPILLDQPHNVINLKVRGCGELLFFKDVNENSMYDMIMKITTDSSYKTNIVRLSNQMLDLPVKPLDDVVWWMEYVIRYKGAPNMKAQKLPWYLFFMLDLVAFLIAVLIAMIYIFYKIYKIIIRIDFVNFIKKKTS